MSSQSRHRTIQLLARASALVWCLAMLIACEQGDSQRAGPTLDLKADSMGIVPAAREIRVRAQRSLVENSGAAMSRRKPGVWFTINDSGNDPELFALDTTGAARGTWTVRGVENRDWETLALGPCAGPGLPDGATDCVYIGEIGDNDAKHSTVSIHRVVEPRAEDDRFEGELESVTLTFVYEGGPRDVESMYVGPDGTLFFFSKRRLDDDAGRMRPSLIFSLPPDAWQHGDSVVAAALIDSLPIVPGSALGRQITGADPGRGFRTVGVRTYTQLYVFLADSTTGRVRTDIAPTVCNVAGLDEKQGEGLSWFGDRGEWMLTSEGRKEPLWIVDCPAPKAN